MYEHFKREKPPQESKSLYNIPKSGWRQSYSFSVEKNKNKVVHSPIQALAASMKPSVSLQLLDVGQSVTT
jgi:hypothetical protein